MLEKVVIPSFDALTALESKKKIVAGGLPLGDRAFVFIIYAKSAEAWMNSTGSDTRPIRLRANAHSSRRGSTP